MLKLVQYSKDKQEYPCIFIGKSGTQIVHGKLREPGKYYFVGYYEISLTDRERLSASTSPSHTLLQLSHSLLVEWVRQNDPISFERDISLLDYITQK